MPVPSPAHCCLAVSVGVEPTLYRFGGECATVTLTNQFGVPGRNRTRTVRGRNSTHYPLCYGDKVWSGLRESNPPRQFGKLKSSQIDLIRMNNSPLIFRGC
jgi:hypothetical protein